MPAAAPKTDDELIVPARDGVLRMLKAARDTKVRPMVPLLDSTRHATSAKAERVLGWRPRSREDAIVATAESLMKFGVVTA